MQSNLGKVYMIQGALGSQPAKRPPDSVLRQLRELPNEERYGLATSLADAGFTLDAPVDVNGWDYWKTMAQRRKLGFTWVPAGHMANILIAPGLFQPNEEGGQGNVYDPANPPVGAILVPPSETDDPNYQQPKVVTPPPPPPDGQVIFGPQIKFGDFAGAFYVGEGNTVPPGTHATRDGRQYVYIVLGKLGTAVYRKLWVPV